MMQPNGTEIFGAGAAVAAGAATAVAALDPSIYSVGVAALSVGVWSTMTAQYLRNRTRRFELVEAAVSANGVVVVSEPCNLDILPLTDPAAERVEPIRIAATGSILGTSGKASPC